MRERAVRKGRVYSLRTQRRVDGRLRRSRHIEAHERDMTRRIPESEEPHLVPLPSMLHTLRPMYRDLSVQLAGFCPVIRDMWRKRPLWPELVVRLLDGKARPKG